MECKAFVQAIIDIEYRGYEYKWIWGQEDVNYPNGEGRFLSWGAYKELLESL